MSSSHKTKAVKLLLPSPLSSPPHSEAEKMVSGLPYDPSDPQLLDARAYIRVAQRQYATLSPLEPDEQRRALSAMLGSCGSGAFIEPPVYFDYGSNTHLGSGAYLNYNCVLLDVAPIRIGSRTMIASAVQILTATHSTDVEERNSGRELGREIVIGDDCWIGGGAVLLPGVRIGDGAVVGAGAVVVKDVQPYTVVAGNPARKIRDLKRHGGVQEHGATATVESTLAQA